MEESDILRYLYLVDRRLTILTSGIDWKPEYEEELKSIDQELSGLRALINAEHRKEQAAG